MTARAQEATAPPSRWLLIATLAVVTLFTALRLWLAASLDFRSDEAYYWTWSHQRVLSYLDQPPMIAWFERLGQLIFGDTTLGARFAQIAALPLIELLLADIARRRAGSWNAALFVVLALECTLNYGVTAVVVEPSVPLLLFACLFLWALDRLDDRRDPRWWLLVGVAAGLALLSKYIALLLVPAVLLLLLSWPHRRSLATPWPYLAALIAVALFAPVLVWNLQYDWVSFTFQGSRLGADRAPSVSGLVRFGLYELIFVGLLVPATVVGGAVLAARAIRLRSPIDAAIAAAFLVPLATFVARSLTAQINQSWPYFMWPLGVLALAVVLPWTGRWIAGKLVLAALLVTGLPVVLAFTYHALLDTSVWFGRNDPLGQDAGFGDMSARVFELAQTNGATWIATSDYRTYANLTWHIGTAIPVVQINERARFLDFAPINTTTFGGRALYVHSGAPVSLLDGAVLGPTRAMEIVWRGQVMREVLVETLDGFVPDLSPPPGSRAFIATPAPAP